jgi:hypothetical protein
MSLLDDPAHWRARAEEMRRLASTADPGTKALLEVVAQSYDELADRAEKRLGAKPDKIQP